MPNQVEQGIRVSFAGSSYQEFTLRLGEKLTIGRRRECDLWIDDPMVSRCHTVVSYDKHGLTVSDKSSRNGTYIGGRKINRALLQSSSLLQIGSALFLVETDWQAPPGDSSCSSCGRDLAGSGVLHLLEENLICSSCLLSRCSPNSATELEEVKRHLPEDFTVLKRLDTLTRRGCLAYQVQDPLLGLTTVQGIQLPPGMRPEEVEPLLHKVRAHTGLRHPHLLAIYDVSRRQDLLWIHAEPYQGEGLPQLVQRSQGPLAARDALRVMYQVSEAVLQARKFGVDCSGIQPHAVAVDDQGNAKLLDLGILQSVSPEHAPYAARGLGATLFFALVGREPNPGASRESILGALGKQPPGVAELTARLLLEHGPDPYTLYQRGLEALVTRRTGLKANRCNMSYLLNFIGGGWDAVQTAKLERSTLASATAAYLGSFSRGELLEFLSMLEQHEKTGTLEVKTRVSRGSLTLQKGWIVHAEWEKERSRRAISQLLKQAEGTFEFSLALSGRRPSCNYRVSEVVLDAARDSDEALVMDLDV